MQLMPTPDVFRTAIQEGREGWVSVRGTDDLNLVVEVIRDAVNDIGMGPNEIRIFIDRGDLLRVEAKQ